MKYITHEQAIKELLALSIVHRLGESKETLELLYFLEDQEKFARTYYLYRLIGYRPPSDFGLDVSSFWAIVSPHLDELDTFYAPKYFNSHTDDGRWYAFKETELLTDLLTAAKTDYPEKQTTPKTDYPETEEEEPTRNTWDL